MKKYRMPARVLAVVMAASAPILSVHGIAMDNTAMLSGLRKLFLGDLSLQQSPDLSFAEPFIPDIGSLMEEGKFSEVRTKLASEPLRGRFADDWRYLALSAYVSAKLNDLEGARSQTRRIADAPSIESRQALEAWKTFRELGGIVPPERANEVLGVVIETHRAGAATLVAAYSDESTRFLTDAGEAVLGEKEDFPQASREAADRLIELAKQLPETTARVTAPEPPLPGDAHVVVLTPGGFRLHQEAIASATPSADSLRELLVTADDLLSILKRFRAEVAAKPGYTLPGAPAPNITAARSIRPLPGSPVPKDPLEPHMPAVGGLPDMEELFATARRSAQRGFIIVTPEREFMHIPAVHIPFGGDRMGEMFPAGGPWKMAVVSYTKLPFLGDFYAKREIPMGRGLDKCIPFSGYLSAWADAGHNIIVFEGHPSALEAGVRGADVVLIDSGMLPFLQNDWPEVVFRAMKPNGTVLMHRRQDYQLLPVVRKTQPPGWRFGEPDGEQSYTRMLLTTIANAPRGPVRIVAGHPVPSLWPMSDDPDDLEYFATLPFKYDRLNAGKVIGIILGQAKRGLLGLFRAPKRLEAKVVETGGTRARDVAFRLKLTKGTGGSRELEIELEK